MSNYIRFYKENYHFVFFTIVTYNRNPILIENIDILRDAFKYAMSKYRFEIFACNILKDHMHLILKLENTKNYSEIIRLIKYYFSRKVKYNQYISPSKSKKREKGIWQRRFWEHTIRDENDLNKHIDYIHYNSFKHYNIPPKDWKYSSFDKYVKLGFYERNWCNIEDKNGISNINLE